MERDRQGCFGTGKEFYEKYHDDEWGIPIHDDRCLFEMLCLEGAQAGLSWETILKRREGYRRLFHQFKPEIVAKMTDSDLEEILKDPSIIRNRRKVFSVRENARVVSEIQVEFCSLDGYLWKFVNDTPIVNHFETVDEKRGLLNLVFRNLQLRDLSLSLQVHEPFKMIMDFKDYPTNWRWRESNAVWSAL